MGLPLATARPVYSYRRRTPEDGLLRQIVLEQWPALQQEIREACAGRGLPDLITKEVEKFRDCGMLAKAFIRVLCRDCGKEQLVAFSCKTRGICPSCDGERMVEVAAHLRACRWSNRCTCWSSSCSSRR
jgi:ribosomal protein S27E